jgi:hypothetical protein
MVLVRFILNHLAKKSYQLIVLAIHEAVILYSFPAEQIPFYTGITFGFYGIYFGLLVFLATLRYYDIKPKTHNLTFYLERILILK